MGKNENYYFLETIEILGLKVACSIQLNELMKLSEYRRWSGGAMVLGKLPMPGRPTIWIMVGQGPTALAAGGVVWTFLLSSVLSLLLLPLFGRRLEKD